MRVALLTDGIQPYVTGGMQKHSYYIAKHLARKKVDVDLYHCVQNKEYDVHKLEVFTDSEKQYINSHVFEFPRPGKLPGHYLRRSYGYSEALYKHLVNHLDGVDFIYAKGFTAWKLLEAKKRGKKFPPIGVKFHGYEMFQNVPSLKARLEQLLLLKKPALFNNLNADYVFSYGGKITDLINSIGIPASKIIEVPGGIDADWLVDEVDLSGQNKKHFLFIGRYERRKGIKELNVAVRWLLKQKEDFYFHFIGPIPQEKRISSSNVKYYGSVTDPDEIKTIMGQCDVLVCPSYSEGMPNVILEGMARGLSIIATDVGAVNTMVSDENGWLLGEPSPLLIKTAMEAVIQCSDKELKLKKEKSLQCVRDNFCWDVIVDKLIGSISRVI